MRFGPRLTLSMVAPLVLLIVGYGYLDERRTKERFREELRREGRSITRTVQLAMEDAFRDRNVTDVRQLIDQITGFERVYGLRLFTADGTMSYQSQILENEEFRARDALERVLATRQPAETQRKINGKTILTYISPLVSPSGQLYGAVQLLQLESFIDEEVAAARRGIVLLTLVMILVAGGVIILVTRIVVSQPVGVLIENIRSRKPTDRNSRIQPRGSDELKRLASEFNLLWERLGDSQDSLLLAQEERRLSEIRLKNAERLAALGELAAGLAHEIGSPLNVISGRTESLLRRHQSDESLHRSLSIVYEQINRMARIVKEMLTYVQVKEINPVWVDLRELLGSILEFLEYRMEFQKVTVATDYEPGLPNVMADLDQLYEVFLNVLLNALDSMEGGGSLRIAGVLARRDHVDAIGIARDFVEISVEDTGAGIPPENLARIFEPFFTTKGVGKGTGLGLSVAYGIIKEHGGWIEARSEPGWGARVAVFLPIGIPAAIPASSAGREA